MQQCKRRMEEMMEKGQNNFEKCWGKSIRIPGWRGNKKRGSKEENKHNDNGIVL